MGVRQRRARRHSRTHIVGFAVAGFFGFFALLGAALVISMGSLITSWLQELPDYTSADAYLLSEPTQVFDTNGTVIAEYYLQNRRSVDMDQVSDYVLKGIIDTEDKRFYKHNGIDPQGIARAVYAQLSGGSEGASTITQQLVRNTVLADEQFDKTLKRKVREAYLAMQMEKMYTKDQILMMYLNTIYFGHSAYGIEAASITYFNKHANELTLAEAATLCGLPQSPSYYDPIANPEPATERRNIVLDRMLEAGDITQEEYDVALAEPMVTNEGHFMENTSTYPYFADYVKSQLNEKYGTDMVFQGGLKVYTTIDPDYQEAAEEAVKKRLDEIGDTELEAALVAIDPLTGYIKAMVGGRDYNISQFNLATQARRQPGSSFKAFTLIAALQEGMNPDIYINCNSPLTVSPTWTVQNFGNEQYGTITLRNAFALSSNTGFVQVVEAIGADRLVDTAHAMGIKVDLGAYPSLTLGTDGVPPVEMAEGYATIAAGGIHRESTAITKILDRNDAVLYEYQDQPTQAVEPAVATVAIDVMEGVTTFGGTAYTVGESLQVDQPVAGKTGTTENYRDLWFCGITPQLSVSVWVGYREEREIFVGYDNGHPYNTACPIFTYFINDVLEGVPRAEFPTSEVLPTYKDNSEWQFLAGSYNWGDWYGQSYAQDGTEDYYDGWTGDESQESTTTTDVSTDYGNDWSADDSGSDDSSTGEDTDTGADAGTDSSDTGGDYGY